MRRLLLPFLLGFLVIWLFGGAWWYANQQPTLLQKQPTKNIPTAPSFTFVDKAFSLQVDEDISFFQSSYDAHIPEAVNNALFQLVEYLNQSEKKDLILAGKYISPELNNSAFENLGIARAEALKSRLIRLGFDGNRVNTRGIKVGHLDFQEGVVHGVISLQVSPNSEE